MHIPDDIWLQVSRHIDKKELWSLLSVNSVFYNIAMDVHYRYVYIDDSGSSSQRQLLRKLLEKEVAKRVRSLHLIFRSWCIEETQKKKNSGILGRIGRRLSHKIPGSLNRIGSPGRLQEPLTSDALELLVNAMPQMVNVDELACFMWDAPLNFDLYPLFVAVCSSFGHNLLKVHLSGHPRLFCQLLDAKPSFNSVRELILSVTDLTSAKNTTGLNDITAYASFSASGIVPFVKSLAPQLYSFELSSRYSSSFDPSSLFQSLDSLPLLTSLTIHIPFDKSSPSPPALRDLLRRTSSTVINLELRLTPLKNDHADNELSGWFASCLRDDQIFSNLRQLQIYLTDDPLDVDILVAIINRVSGTLQGLIIQNPDLDEEQVNRVANALRTCHSLLWLAIRIRELDVKVFDHLARALPHLRILSLSSGSIMGERTGFDSSFFADMDERRYDNWKLLDISVLIDGHRLDDAGMACLVRSIPSLKSFHGEFMKSRGSL